MGRLEFTMKNVKQMADGRLYFRRKIKGKDSYIRLPDYDDPEFQNEYDRLITPDSAVERAVPQPKPGTIAALITAYRASSDFTGIESSETVSNYLRYLDMIRDVHGHRSVTGVRPAHIYVMRDAYKDMPGKANNWLTVFRVLMAYAAKMDWRGDNPASGVRALPIGEHEPWPADLVRVCLDVASPMTRRIIVTGLCGGQRIGDAIRMNKRWIDDKIMSFRQGKTGVLVSLPMHPFWLAELDKPIVANDVNAMTLLYDRFGKPFASTGTVQARIRDLMAKKEVQQVIADLIAREMIQPGTTFVFHGLRKNACCYLLELGLSDTEVGSMLGMSPKMVRHYGKRARALMIARGSAERVAGGTILQMAGVQKARSGPSA